VVAGRSIRIGVGLAPHRGVPRFTPGSLFANAGSGGWYDFCDLTTLYQSGTRGSPGPAVSADGDPVGLVLDKSGNNNDLVQATSTKRPLYKTSGGVSWLQFDGVDDYLSSAAAFNLSAYGQIALATAFTPSTTATVLVAELGPNTSSTGGTFFIAVNNTAVGALDIAINGAGIDDNGTTSTAYGSGVTSEFSCQKLDITDGSAATRAPLRVNGASAPSTVAADAGTAGTAFSGIQTLYVGARAGTSLFFAGKMHGLFIRGNSLGADEINNLDTWMLAKTVAASASSSTGTGASIEDADTTAASGTVAVAGTGASTETANTTTGSGAASVSASGASTEGTDATAGTGAASVSATGASVEGADTTTATGAVNVTGSGSSTEGIDTASGAGTVAVAASGASAEGADNGSGSGTVAQVGSTGAGAANDNDDTTAASGLVFISGDGASGETNDTGSATGLTLSGIRFVITPKPANVNLTSVTNPSETNVIGPPRPSKVTVTTVSAVSGTFVPSAKPPRVQWRT
jgi:hypothetical protein